MERSPPFYARLLSFLFRIFGRFSWNSPPWLKYLRHKIRLQKWGIYCLSSILIVISIAYAGSYFYYAYAPPTTVVASQISPPSITPNDKILSPRPLTIDFGVKTADVFVPISAAPIHMIGKQILGIKISPEIQGKWKWQDESQLIFTPASDWPAGQKYRITFDKDIFASGISMAKYHCEFVTRSLDVDVADLRLYQDLKDPSLKKIVGTLNFNFPVDGESLRQHLHLAMQAHQYPLTITFDKHERIAYIESSPLTLPQEPCFINLMIAKGVHAKNGPSQTDASIRKKLLIPDASSFFQINSVTVGIERNKNDNPEQILYVETSVGISHADLAKYLHVSILPKDYPATDFQPIQKNYSWSRPGEVTQDVLRLSKSVQIHAFPDEHPFPTFHRYKMQTAVPSDLYIQIIKGATGFGGFILTHDYATVMQAPEYPQEIHFLHKGSLMALSGTKNLTVSVRGIPEVKFSISQVLLHNLNHLVTQTYGNFQNPKFLHGSFDSDAVSHIFSELRQFNVTNSEDLQFTSLDLGQYLEENKNSLGLFLLKAQAWDRKADAPTGIENDRLILITDMDLIVKDNADESHELFVQSITLGTPVAGAEAALLGKNGLPIISATTDAEGHVHFPSMKDFKDDRAPTAYLVRNGSDVSFIPFQWGDRRLNYSRFNVGGMSSESERNLNAYIFSDRDIYCPGDRIQIGAIVKDRFASSPTTGIPLQVVMTDSRGTTVLDQKLSLPSSHFFSINYLLPATANTGQYNVNIYIVKDNQLDNLLGFKSLRIEEFLPDRLKMKAQLISGNSLQKDAALGWLSPLDMKAKINLRNLFGTPAVNHRVTAKLILSPSDLYIPQFAEYRFVDPLIDPSKQHKVLTENLSEMDTDDKGEVQFHLNLERFEKATYRLSFFAEGFELGGGRGVSQEISTLVAPFKYLVGYKSNSDLGFIKHQSRQNVHVIAIDPELIQIRVNNLQVQLFEINTVSTLVQKADGTYKYQSVQQELPVRTYPFEINSQGSELNLPTEMIGDFALVLTNEDSDILSKIYFSVVGESENPLYKNAELTVKLNRAEYQPGETVEMQITSPYIGSGLISIERDKVYAYKWFKTDTTTSVQTIALPSDFQGNGYINIAFVRAWDSDEIFINPLSYAVIPFTISHEQQVLHVQLNAPAFVRPGESLPIQFSTDKPAKIILFAVDEGILQVADYQTPDPLAYFFRKQALTVDTSQIADLILPKYTSKEASAVGGDGHTKLLAMNLNPFKRKTEKAVAFWSGIVDSDVVPKIINYQVPDYFNGNLRVMAVAVAPESIGNAVTQTDVQAYFVISPLVPQNVTPKDTFTVTAAITNGMKDSDSEKPILVSLEASPSLEIMSPEQVSIMIPPGQERTVAFQIRAMDVLGNAQLAFTAEQSDKSSKMNAMLSVRPANSYRSILISGFDDSSSKTIDIDQQFYPEHRLLQAVASSNPLILANGLQSYLTSYPHECTEQLISKAFAKLAMAQQPFFQLDPERSHEEFRQTLQFLRQRQTCSGGFSYWPGSGDNHAGEVASIYAMDYLTEAQLSGYPVPADLFNSVKKYLVDFLKRDMSSLSDARLQAYTIYLLTRTGIVTTNYLTNLHLYLTTNHDKKWHKDIASAYMAATYKLLQSVQEANDLIRGYEMQHSSTRENEFCDILACDAQYVTLLARHFPERSQTMSGNGIVALASGIAGDRLNTLSASYCLQALCAYGKMDPSGVSDPLSISEVLPDNTEKNLSSLVPDHQKVNFDSQAKQVCFHNLEKKPYFYQITQSGFAKVTPQYPVKNGLEIYKEYRNSEGKIISSVKHGEIIDVNIKARSVNKQTINSVAVVDLLPGGFEIIPESVKQSDSDYVDLREDRVIFYCSLTSSVKELSYRLRAVNKGDYAVPPIFAQSMYNPSMQAQDVQRRIVIE